MNSNIGHPIAQNVNFVVFVLTNTHCQRQSVSQSLHHSAPQITKFVFNNIYKRFKLNNNRFLWSFVGVMTMISPTNVDLYHYNPKSNKIFYTRFLSLTSLTILEKPDKL